MTNPWLGFGASSEEDDNPWLDFLDEEEERRRRKREQMAAATAFGDEQAERLDLPDDTTPTHPHLMVGKMAGLAGRAAVEGVTNLPGGLVDMIAGAMAGGVGVSPAAAMGASRNLRRSVGLEVPGAERAEEWHQEGINEFAEATAHLPTPAAAAAFWLAETAGGLADPLELLPGGMIAAGVGGLADAARAGRAASAVPDDLAELARVSQGIGASPPATSRVASVRALPAARGEAVRQLEALDAAGERIGGMTYSVEPGGGFRVMDVETGARGTGGMRAMMRQAAETSGGPYLGSMAETDEGAAALARLQETDPRIFLRAGDPAAVGPEVHLPSGEAGYVKVRAGVPEGSPGFFDRWFSTWGDYAAMGDEIGEATAEAKRLTGAAVAAEGRRAEMVVRDAAAEIKTYHDDLAKKGFNRPLDETLEWALSGLEGEHAFPGAPLLGERMRAARDHLDELSTSFADQLDQALRSDYIKSPEWRQRATELRETIRQNKGQWTRRSFEAFTNGDWAALVKAPDSPEHWRWTNFVEWAENRLLDAEFPQARMAEPDLLQGAPAPAGLAREGAVPRGVDPLRPDAAMPPLGRGGFRRNPVGAGAEADPALVALREPMTREEKLLHSRRTEEELRLAAEGLANKYLRRDPEVFFGVGGRTLIPSERLGSAKARLDLPQQIDDLLGLHKDPTIRYRESVLNLAHDIESLRFKTQLLERGQGKIFFDEPTGNFSHQLQARTGLDPLAGKYTSPEVGAVIDAVNAGGRETAQMWPRWLSTTSSLVKAGKTVGSPFVTHPRNMLSWVPQLSAQGHFVAALNPRRWVSAGATVAAGKVTKGGLGERALQAMARHIHLADGRRLSDVADYQRLDVLRERLVKLQRAGVLGESATAGDVAHYRGVLGEVKTLAGWKNERVGQGVLKVWKALEWLYGAEDDLGKLVAFDALHEDLRWARQGDSADDVFGEAARRIRDTTPTYSKIAPATRTLRDNPFISAFPTFTQEIYRNTKNGAVLAFNDLRSSNPRMKILGAKRLAGLFGTAMAPLAIKGAAQYMTGIDDETLASFREFVAPWDRSALLVPISIDGYDIGYVNLSYTWPQSIFLEPLIAASMQIAQGEGPTEDVVEATLGAAWEAAEPFLSREILIDGILDFAWRTRGEFWDPRKPVDVNARAIAHALHRTASPGGALWMERVAKAAGFGEALEAQAADEPEGPGRATTEFVASLFQEVDSYGKKYQLGDELIAGGTGIRRQHNDVMTGLGFRLKAFNRARADASTALNRVTGHPSTMPPSVILERRREANEMVRSSYLETRRSVEAIRRIGHATGKDPAIVERDLRRMLKEERVGEEWTAHLLRGTWRDPYR